MEACSTAKIVHFININCGKDCNFSTVTYQMCDWKDPLCDIYALNTTLNQYTCSKCIFMNPILVIIDNKCSFSCPISTAPSSANNSVFCISCQPNCISCTSTFCIRCSASFVINPVLTTQCISTCPDGYASDGYQCVQCKTNCKTCELDGRCLSCMDTSAFILT